MTNTQKKVAIGLGIVALLVWYSKKGKPTETPTEEPSGGGGGGGIGGAMPSGITMITTPVATTTTTTKTTTTPTNLSPSLKGATSVQNAGNAPIIPKINATTGLPIGSMGGGIRQAGQVINATPYTPTSGGTVLGNTSTSTTNTTNASNSSTATMNESVKCPNNKIYSVSSADIKASGGSTSWCQRNGHYAGSTNFVGFDGKIKRHLRKVDFF